MNLVNPDLIEVLERALAIAAEVALRDPEKLPIFDRIDRELQAARAQLALRDINDPISRARELLKIKQLQTL